MTRPVEPINHGTYGGAQVHQRRGIPLCEPCKQARAAYRRQYLADNPPDQAQRNRTETNARRRAQARLAAEHPHRFAELLDEELAEEEP